MSHTHPSCPPRPTYGCWCCWLSVGLWLVLHNSVPQQPQGSGELGGDGWLCAAAVSVLGTPGRHSPEQREEGTALRSQPIRCLCFLVSISLIRRLLEDPGCTEVGGLGSEWGCLEDSRVHVGMRGGPKSVGSGGLRGCLEDFEIHVGCVEDSNPWGLEDSGAVVVFGGLQGPREDMQRTQIYEVCGGVQSTPDLWGCVEDPTPTSRQPSQPHSPPASLGSPGAASPHTNPPPPGR